MFAGRFGLVWTCWLVFVMLVTCVWFTFVLLVCWCELRVCGWLNVWLVAVALSCWWCNCSLYCVLLHDLVLILFGLIVLLCLFC